MRVEDLDSFKEKALHWASSFDVCCYLDSNNYPDLYGKFDFIIAAGADDEICLNSGEAFKSLKHFQEKHQTWLFGMLGYDLKNETEQLSSSNKDALDFPDLYFFVPTHLILSVQGNIRVVAGDDGLLDIIDSFDYLPPLNSEVTIQSRLSRDEYISTVKALQLHIARGDIYEANFCQEFFAEQAIIDPAAVYLQLKKVSPTPFSGFFKVGSKFTLCASPERFLCKRADKIISQPIKGTAKRNADAAEDERIRIAFSQDVKEQSENVMIVDLVRNDLTKSAVKGSVVVDELFGVYGFPQVFQMISTISCKLDERIHFIDAIKQAFPMGSMTGAPKLKAMELIEKYELRKRGTYSGALGYIEPNGDFDFNVIIRSILYNAEKQYLSFQVGGAITYVSDPENEYEECQLKASAIMKTLVN